MISVWGKIATKIEIKTWPKDVGADYLIARTGRSEERDVALALSEVLGGLPLAHEQAAAYCEDIHISLSEYRRRFELATFEFLNQKEYAPAEYHPEHQAENLDRLTVAGTFLLAIEQAAKRHPASQSLIVHAAQLAPEPIPLFLFSEKREMFDEPLASALKGDGLDKAVAALRAFALISRESIPDERDPSITTDCIRLHRLVRQVAAAQCEGEARENVRQVLIKVLAKIYPADVFVNSKTWPVARRLDVLAMALANGDTAISGGAEKESISLLNLLASYRAGPLAAYALARPLLERALEICEKTLDIDAQATSASLNNLGYLLRAQGDFAGARPHFERALAIDERVFGPDDPEVATDLNNLGSLLQSENDLIGARRCYERAFIIYDKARGSDHPDTAISLNNLGDVAQAQGDLAGAKLYFERALLIFESALGSDSGNTATVLNNLGYVLRTQGDFAGARVYYQRALGIRETVLGPDHPDTAASFHNQGALLNAEGDLPGALPYLKRALSIFAKVLGPDHPNTRNSVAAVVKALTLLNCDDEAMALREKYGFED